MIAHGNNRKHLLSELQNLIKYYSKRRVTKPERKMADDELAAFRAKRMQELQSQYGGANPEDQRKQQEAAQRKTEMTNAMLSQILDQNARARLNSIALVKPDKAKRVEAMLIQMAQRGQLGEKMSEQQLIGLLEQIGTTQTKTTVKFERRRVMDSDSDDSY